MEQINVTIFYSEVIELERAILINALGLLRAIQAGEIIPDEAEALLFKPGMSDLFQKQGVSEEVLDFIERGYFLDDIFSLFGEEKLQNLVRTMQVLAIQLLNQRPLKDCYAGALPTKKDPTFTSKKDT